MLVDCCWRPCAPLLGRWRPSSERARKRCAPACSSALPPRAPLARTAHHRRSCCVRARRIVPPEARATRGLHHSQSSMMEGMMPPAAPPPGARVKGTVSRWTERGFGFITPEDGGEDLFCHFSNVEDVDFLLVSTAYLREPWCACSAMPAHAAPAALGLRVPALLRVCCASPSHACLRWHPHALCLLARAAVTTPTATSRTAAATPHIALAHLGVCSLALLGMLGVSGPAALESPRESAHASRCSTSAGGVCLGSDGRRARCARCARARGCIVCTACRRASALRCASSLCALPLARNLMRV